jgi:hypothetical protein
MIRIEITCGHADQPRARDAKHPCDSTRGRPLQVDSHGVMEEAVKAVKRQADERGWTRLALPALGRRLGYVCRNCRRRHDGEI